MSEYCRVYYDVIDDPKFKDIYPDKVALGWWLTLLLIADAMWPASAPLPYGIDEGVLARLVTRQIVVVDGPMFRIKGLDSERQKRSKQAASAANMRWHSDRNATASAANMPSRAEPSKAEQSREDDGDANAMRPHDAAAAFYDLQGGQASPKALKWVDELSSEYGDDAVISEMAQRVSDGRVDLKATQSALALAANQKRKEAEARRKAAEAKYQADLESRIANATPEEKARAEDIKAGIDKFLKGGTA